MRRSTAWWIVGTLMLFVGITLSRIGVAGAVPPTAIGAALAVARGLGYAVGVALLALLIAVVTRFRYPWLVLGAYAVCVVGVVVAKHDNAVQHGLQSPATAGATLPGFKEPFVKAAPKNVSTTPAEPTWLVSPTVPPAPQPPNAVIERARWDADARAFIAMHPDLQFNENLEIMDSYTRALTRNNPRGYDNATILAIAYTAAKADPRWSKHDIVISMHG